MPCNIGRSCTKGKTSRAPRRDAEGEAAPTRSVQIQGVRHGGSTLSRYYDVHLIIAIGLTEVECGIGIGIYEN